MPSPSPTSCWSRTWASIPSGWSTPSTTPTTKPARCGKRWRAWTIPAWSAWATRTTSGPWAKPARVARAARSTSIRATTFPAPRPRRATPAKDRPATATAGSRSGTWSSCSSNSSPTARAARCLGRRSTPVWASNACAPSSAAFARTTKPISSARSSPRWKS